MDTLTHSSISNKIPEYAKDFRKEWLYIRGINQKCGEYMSRINIFGRDLFTTTSPYPDNLMCYIIKFLKDQECGRLKDISGFYFEYFDVSNIEFLKEKMGKHLNENIDLIVDTSILMFKEEFCDRLIEIHFPGYKDLLELISLINYKIKREELNI